VVREAESAGQAVEARQKTIAIAKIGLFFEKIR
jgi:hypothetical protein